MLPNNGEVFVSRIEASKFDTATVYVAFDNHRWGDFKPYLFVSNDGGKSFRSLVNNLPVGGPGDFLHVIREDPYNRDLLFVGTSIGVYASHRSRSDVDQVHGESAQRAGVRLADPSARS